jgi:hypothetical protein
MTELDPGAKQLIALAGDADGPTATERSRLRGAVLARVGATVVVASAGSAAVSTTASAAGATAAASGSLVALVAKVVGVAAVVSGIGTGGYLLVSSDPPASAPAAAIATSSPPNAHVAQETTPASQAEAPRLTPPPVATPMPPVPASTTTATGHVPVVEAAAVPAPRPPQKNPAPPESFEEETRDLRDALAALRDGHPESALASIDAQDARYGAGGLGEERGAARIECLCAMGRTDDARAAASSFLRQHPRSLQAARVGASCGGNPGSSRGGTP